MLEMNGISYYSEFEFADGVLLRYHGNWPFGLPAKIDRIPFDHITEIGEGCFYGMEIASAVIPEGVVAIADSAFENCAELESVTLPSTLQTIGDAAFAGCAKLTGIELPKNLKTVGKRAFAFTGLSEIVFPDTVAELGEDAFFGCGNLERAVLPPVRELPSELFHGCRKLANVSIPNGVEVLAPYAFSRCDALALGGSLAVPPSVREWALAFSGNDVDIFNIYAEKGSFAYIDAESLGVRRYPVIWGPGIREWRADE